jgi:putative ABC transport system substrate-binding protein
VIMPYAADDPESSARSTVFLQTLQQLGWSNGRNMRVESRWSGGDDPTRVRRSVGELVALAPDIILATATSTLGPLLEATQTIPIVFVSVIDPVGSGFVAPSGGHPGPKK